MSGAAWRTPLGSGPGARTMAAALVVAAAAGACTADPSSPSRTDVAGIYRLTELRFDPLGILPEVDVFDRLAPANVPQLILAPGGQVQLVFQDPETGLLSLTNGTYTTPQDGARIDFGSDPAYRAVLLSRRMTFAFDREAGTLFFDDEAPDGVSRERLLQLVPEWSDEQLLDPVPGRLVVGFLRSD